MTNYYIIIRLGIAAILQVIYYMIIVTDEYISLNT